MASRPGPEGAPATEDRERRGSFSGVAGARAVRYALRQVLESLSRPAVRQREERLSRFLEEEIWPLFPPDQLGKPLSEPDREHIPGSGEDGA